MKSINGQTLKQMFISGANNLYNHYPEVDALNVFPVPDGDTGMNMNLTMTSGSNEIFTKVDDNVYVIAKAFSRGLLMGARGNSGVITSQIFRGFADGCVDKKELNIVNLSNAFENGVKVAYKAVIKPVEGTILTVIREASDKLRKNAVNIKTIEKAFDCLLNEARRSLENTPNLLPILKEVGVVDSGGAGLVKILEGMKCVLQGDFVERNKADVVEKIGNAQVAADSEETEFGYCTEFILRLGPDSTKKVFNKERFTNVLSAHGNSLVVVQDEDLVKVHVHTIKPGDIFNYAQQFGEFVKMKCENMTEQHNEILFNEEQIKNQNKVELAVEMKEFGMIATSSGDGVSQTFKDLGIDYIVSGGQTMNPSTNDFVEAIKSIHAKNVYIFPNNGNIIMAANQARDVMADKVNVIVIPTKTIPQGLTSCMYFSNELSVEDNEKAMNDAIKNVFSGAVTFAIKDTEINGVSVKKDQFMAIKESKNIISCSEDKVDALMCLVAGMVNDESGLITVFYGEDVDKEDAERAYNLLTETYKDLEIDFKEGNQPVYSFLVGIE